MRKIYISTFCLFLLLGTSIILSGQALDVQGEANIDDDMFVEGTLRLDDPTGGKIFFPNGSNVAGAQISYSQTSDQLSILNTNGGGTILGGSNILRTLSSGDVTLGGATTARAKLQISHNSSGGGENAHLELQETSNNDFARLTFRSIGDGLQENLDKYWTIAAAPGGGTQATDMNFYYWNGSSGSNVMTISGLEKRVGILNVNPTYQLHMKHNSGSPTLGGNNGLAIEVATGNTNEWIFYASSQTDQLRLHFNDGNDNPDDGVVLVGTFDNSGGYSVMSDGDVSKNHRALRNQLDKIKQLRPKSYQRKDQKNNKNTFGLFAEELQEIYPEVVSQVQTLEEDGIERLGINYSMLVPVLVSGVQEQQAIIEEKEQQINDLEKEVVDIKSRFTALENMITERWSQSELPAPESAVQHQTIDLNVPQLAQNEPNPFRGNTTIRYYLPSDGQSAQLQIMNSNGVILKTQEINNFGHGSISLNTNELAAGSYQYALVINGQVVDSKQMILTR